MDYEPKFSQSSYMIQDLNLTPPSEEPEKIFLQIKKIPAEDINTIKNELIELFNMEVKARDTYFQELRRFEGIIFETIKWLSYQEARHIQIIQVILSRANIMVKEQKTIVIKMNPDQKEIIKYDLAFEDNAVNAYKNAAGKTKGELKKILSILMGEEVVHVERLKEYAKK
ncbi:MAG: hypothetical protein NTZ73_02825 [Candidatus Diapherotrites archaeon]|nr:hypothetical protein [Candidatus Diapherotrites archaeon]